MPGHGNTLSTLCMSKPLAGIQHHGSATHPTRSGILRLTKPDKAEVSKVQAIEATLKDALLKLGLIWNRIACEDFL